MHGHFDRLIERGHTIVYVTHHLETVSRFADRVLLLERGKEVALGPPEEVLEEYHRRNSEYKRKRDRLEASEPAPVESQVTGQPLGEYGDAERVATPRRFADVVVMLARAEFKLRYLDSVIGYVWSLAQPLLLYLVLYFSGPNCSRRRRRSRTTSSACCSGSRCSHFSARLRDRR